MEHVDFFMDIIEDFAKKESMKSAIMASIEHIQEDNYSMVEEEIRKALTVSRNMSLGQIYFDDVTNRWIRNVERRNEAKYRTVFKTLNKELDGGLSAKELAMVVAPPGVGKSLYLVNQGVQALMEERKVLYISLEMSEDKIAQRFDSVISQIGQGYLEHKQGDLLKRLSIFKKNFVDSNLVTKEYPTGLAKVSDIRALLSQLRNFEAFEPDLIIVDYLGLVAPIDRSLEGRFAYLARARELRHIASSFGVALWSAHQTNRPTYKAARITKEDSSEAIGVTETADVIITLNQTGPEETIGVQRWIIDKARERNPRVCEWHVNAIKDEQRFSDTLTDEQNEFYYG